MRRPEIVEAIRRAVDALDKDQKSVARHLLVSLIGKMGEKR